MHALHHRRYKRRVRLIVGLLFVLLIAGSVGVYYIYKSRTKDTGKIIGASSVQHIAGPELYKTSYFEFSASERWVLSSTDSTANKFTYLLYLGGVVSQTLTIYVNQTPIPDYLGVTMVLPVNIKDADALTVAGPISQPCGNLYGPTELKQVKTISIEGTSIVCVPESEEFTVVVGQLGGNYQLRLKRANGQLANYIIIYDNVSVGPDPSPFLQLLPTFQAI